MNTFMHSKLPKLFFFINTYDENHIRKLPKKVAIIFRNYETEYDEGLILNIKRSCQKQGRKFFLSNNLKLAIKLDLDGAYLPSFNKSINIIKSDIVNSDEIEEILLKIKPDVIVNLAAQVSFKKSVEDPFLDFQINLLGTLNILEVMLTFRLPPE